VLAGVFAFAVKGSTPKLSGFKQSTFVGLQKLLWLALRSSSAEHSRLRVLTRLPSHRRQLGPHSLEGPAGAELGPTPCGFTDVAGKWVWAISRPCQV
jgi:hypothetical protein